MPPSTLLAPPSAASPKLETIAQAAGVSISTVSRALQKNPQIARATQTRIRDIATRLGYVPNPYVSTLMAHVRQHRPLPYQANLGWIDRLPANTWRHNPVQSQFFEGAVHRAGTLGYQIERVSCLEADMTPRRLRNIMRARGINGVLCSADTPESRQTVLPFDVNSFAVVTVGCRFTKPDLHYSTNDQFYTARMAHQHLQQLGYRRVGFVTTRGLEDIVEYRFTGGFQSAAPSLGPEQAVPVFYTDGQPGDPAFADWLRTYRPDAVLTTFMVDLLDQITATGLRVPEDLGFAVLDWDARTPHIAGVRQDHRRTGAAAVDVLVAQLQSNEYGVPEHARGVMIEGAWQDGPTAPPR
ncbi:LacI family DNA-binding transcriptional regulator [Actomonas aquatica]|uniref:LacI family DNA-binding transcriptional regulator n=1 Tax=Actomonas aquatica TaxID=2866162 RepID=A0ABZ1C3Z1_9BACT|nr:LacI family DNA-binding transcriptional regulator [Opitutus sp. WL0086]WRQ86399.1 LacI family DNA-binding transcriptional regulator [Opitutus sp. WL0086]